MKEGKVRTGDGSLFYSSTGKGEPLILLHSLGVSSESWKDVIPALSKKFTVYAIDLMGHGNSDKPDKNYEIYDYANSIIQLMNGLKIDRASVIGNSIGAMVSLEMSASFPKRVVKQVLVGCPAFNDWERAERLMFSASRYNLEGNPQPMTMEELGMTYAHPPRELLDWVNSLRARAGLWCKKAQIAVAIWDIMPRLPLVRCPTLVLFGSADFLRETEHVLLNGIKNVKPAVIEGAGHVPQIDDPEAFIKSVMEFL